MAIKLYKSQLTPTTESSNVMNRNRVSMSEAASIGNAWKGMVRSGELLYAKHQDIKTDNEILEKSKEVMNGGENYTGLSETTINASQMKDPDAAGKLYNDEWQNIFDNVNGSLSGKLAQRKFKSFMTKQNLKDVNAIKTASTTNMINALRINTLDQIETLKKTAIFGTSLESNIASKELSDLLGSKKTSDIFGNTLQKVVKQTNNEIAFTGYKRMPYTQKDEVLAAAEKDKRITAQDLVKLENHFNSAKTTDNNVNKGNISKLSSNLYNDFIYPDQDEYNSAVEIANQNGDEKSLIKLKQMAIDTPILQGLNFKTPAELDEKINTFTTFKNKKGSLTIAEANELKLTQGFKDKLVSNLDKDVLTTAAKTGVITISEINFEDILNGAEFSVFEEAAKNRIPVAETGSSHYKREVKYLTVTEAKTIKSVLDNIDTAPQLIDLATTITRAFGVKSDKVFKQLSKDNNLFAHLGGLVLMNNPDLAENQKPVIGENVKLAAQGFVISQNENLSKLYKISPTDIKASNIIKKYSALTVFGTSEIDGGTLDATIETALLIFTAQLKNKGQTVNNYTNAGLEKAFIMAAGGTTIEGFPFNKDMGGFDKDTHGNPIHIPPWFERGKFTDVIEMLKANPDLVLKAANGMQAVGAITGDVFESIFSGEDPYFISVDDGVYKIANQGDPNTENDPGYVLNSNKGFFTINLNLIKSEILNGIEPLPNTTIEDNVS